MMFQPLGCCTLLYIFPSRCLLSTTASFFKRERGRHVINPSSTLPPLRRPPWCHRHRQRLNPNSGNDKKGFEVPQKEAKGREGEREGGIGIGFLAYRVSIMS
ncbi:hypothetical protein Hdeb2414_s0010g00329671 [Helianthus debilis subsp. tardiflorus]